MEAKFINLDEFIVEIRTTYELDEPKGTFINFILNINDVYYRLKKEIRNYSTNLDEQKYMKFKKKVKDVLVEVNSFEEYKDIEIINPWIEKYKFSFQGVESILNLANYPEIYTEGDLPNIYRHLYGEGIQGMPEQYSDEIYFLQRDFLYFTKANLIESLYNLLKNNNSPLERSVKWKGTQSELLGLIKSLIESRVFDEKLPQKEIIKRFEFFLDFKINNPDQNLTKIRNRTKDLTPFIDKLRSNLERWIKSKDNQ